MNAGYRQLVRDYGQRRVARAARILAGERVTTRRDMLDRMRVEIERILSVEDGQQDTHAGRRVGMRESDKVCRGGEGWLPSLLLPRRVRRVSPGAKVRSSLPALRRACLCAYKETPGSLTGNARNWLGAGTRFSRGGDLLLRRVQFPHTTPGRATRGFFVNAEHDKPNEPRERNGKSESD